MNDAKQVMHGILMAPVYMFIGLCLMILFLFCSSLFFIFGMLLHVPDPVLYASYGLIVVFLLMGLWLRDYENSTQESAAYRAWRYVEDDLRTARWVTTETIRRAVDKLDPRIVHWAYFYPPRLNRRAYF